MNNSFDNKILDIRLSPERAAKRESILYKAAQILRVPQGRIADFKILKRSIDARKKQVLIVLKIEVFLDEAPEFQPLKPLNFPKAKEKTAIIVGFGPAGMFAALQLLENGIRPIIFERGKNVKDRRRDLAAIFKDRKVDGDSNYCFGEGGAGTYSDGKLYTRSKKRGDIRKILEIFVTHGAKESILYDAHPHIGTNKLPRIVQNIRETIIAEGGEVLFEHKVEKILIKNGRVKGVQANGEEYLSNSVILATGHSARDIFEMLDKQKIAFEAKPFALGVRIEHPQSLIDSIQYKCESRGEYLPAASYSLVRQVNGNGVFSFCMCPGGIIAPAMTNPGEVVVNGWSPSNRDGKFANSGFVVQVNEKDWKSHFADGRNRALSAMDFQAKIEKDAFAMGGSDLSAPAQRILDFVKRRPSHSLPDCSYLPGIVPGSIDDLLPNKFSHSIREALKFFGKRMPGFVSQDSVLVGVESRTSSPVRIPRDRESLEHPDLKGFYPCGEGAGYAGGIMSAGLDGIACAEALAQNI